MMPYQKSKFSEMPGFDDYKEALEKAGVFVEDRIVRFTVPESVNKDMVENLIVVGTKWYKRSISSITNAEVVHCEALFAYGEEAMFWSDWQWLVINDKYVDDTNEEMDFYWASTIAWPSREFKSVVEYFNGGIPHGNYFPCNVTDSTNSVKWMTWMIDDVLDYVKRLREERNQ